MLVAVLLSIAFAATVSAAPVSFSRDVRPVLWERCQLCHQEKNRSGKLSVASVASLLEGGASGPAIKPGQPEASVIVAYISGPKPRMPKVGEPLTAGQVAVITQWIAEGAKDDSPAHADDDTWWSLKPLKSPPVPVSDSKWPRNPIDSFILAKLKASSLTTSPEADRRTLIRRLSFDLLGLPPDPAEVEAFVNDSAPDAYEKLVDRMLASPRYGERWARHWLDVVHYGDSHGYDKDKPRPNAWPYRDYVIQAFNSDKPYARFIMEQIAADALFPDQPEVFPATGFLAAGPWDFVGHQELREGSTDKEITRLLDRDDMVAATMSTFTSMTAHCARCHNHKFDPIPQVDYYSLQAVFAGVDRADVPYDLDPAVNRQRRQLMHQKQEIQIRLQPLLDKVEFATNPEIVQLDNRIQDARAQIVHMGEPKTQADIDLKAKLQTRLDADRARRKELVDAIVGPQTYVDTERIQQEMKAVDEQIAALPKPEYVYTAASFFPRVGNFRPSLTPRPVHLLARGSVQTPLELVHPGALSCLKFSSARFESAETGEESARRAALARWLADSRNVLTWRSIVNRIWHFHFGTGIVDTPSDFGRMGSKPSHAELLDWLAVWFRDEAGGSFKKLHRLILTSAAYRQSSAARPEALRVDSENRLLWRMNRLRLDAESVRDSVLTVTGLLDTTMYGPAVRMFYFKDDHSPVYDYSRFDPDAPGAYRRSIYRFIVRSVPDPFMERLDCPDPSILTPKRSTTLTAIQALVLLNNPFMVRMASHWAERLQQAKPTLDAQIQLAARQAFGADLPAPELEMLLPYARQYGLDNLCRLLFNANQFLFID